MRDILHVGAPRSSPPVAEPPRSSAEALGARLRAPLSVIGGGLDAFGRAHDFIQQPLMAFFKGAGFPQSSDRPQHAVVVVAFTTLTTVVACAAFMYGLVEGVAAGNVGTTILAGAATWLLGNVAFAQLRV